MKGFLHFECLIAADRPPTFFGAKYRVHPPSIVLTHHEEAQVRSHFIRIFMNSLTHTFDIAFLGENDNPFDGFCGNVFVPTSKEEVEHLLLKYTGLPVLKCEICKLLDP